MIRSDNWATIQDAILKVCMEIYQNGMKNINISVDEEDEWTFIIDVSDIIDVRESLLIDDSNEKCFLNIIIEKEKQLLDENSYSFFEVIDNVAKIKRRSDYRCASRSLKNNKGAGWGKFLCELISRQSDNILAQKWNSLKELTEEDKKSFSRPFGLTVREWDFYRTYINSEFCEDFFEDIKEWWGWLWNKNFYLDYESKMEMLQDRVKRRMEYEKLHKS